MGEASGGYFDLGFTLPLQLGAKQWAWEITAWVAVAAGMFLRQALNLPQLDWDTTKLDIGAFLAALVVGLAVFPPMMRWLNRRQRKVGLEHIALPFAFGFFLNLVSLATLHFVVTRI
jgi:hypothetical protein